MLKNFVGMCGIILVAATSSQSAAAASQASSFGILTKTRGLVSIQGSPALPGATVMSGDVLTAGAHSAANFSLHSRSSVTVLPNTQVSVLPEGAAEGVRLHGGSIVVQDQSVSPMRVRIPGAWVLVRGEYPAGALCEISSLGTNSKVALQRGFAEIHGAGAPVVLHPGEWARLEVGGKPYEGQPQSGQQSSAQEAGKVTREIPRGRLDRRGQVLPLTLNDPVEWNDQIHTFESGRLQITLLDGSLLSVGSRSEMKIVRHAADTQQTQIELGIARMRADVQKITKTGGKFEVRTKTAVIGVVGTSLVVAADQTRTRVCVIDGEVEVRSSNPSVAQTSVHVQKGDCSNIRQNSPPSAPSAGPSDIAKLVSQTNVGDSAATAAGASGAASAAGTSTAMIATVVAVGVAATFGGLAAAGEFSSSRSPLSAP